MPYGLRKTSLNLVTGISIFGSQTPNLTSLCLETYTPNTTGLILEKLFKKRSVKLGIVGRLRARILGLETSLTSKGLRL